MIDQDLAADVWPAESFIIRDADALQFAQSQFASDVAALKDKHWQWSAWLDVTGTVRMLCMLIRDGDALQVVMRGGGAREACTDLARYIMRARVTLEVLDGLYLSPGPSLPAYAVDTDARQICLGLESRSLLLDQRPHNTEPGEREAFALADIRAGFPWLPANAVNTWLPPALGLHSLTAVSTSKGCYPGQEIVARLHHRGGNKYRLIRMRNPDGDLSGADLLRGDTKTGMILMHAADEALAIARIDALHDMKNGTVLQQFGD